MLNIPTFIINIYQINVPYLIPVCCLGCPLSVANPITWENNLIIHDYSDNILYNYSFS